MPTLSPAAVASQQTAAPARWMLRTRLRQHQAARWMMDMRYAGNWQGARASLDTCKALVRAGWTTDSYVMTVLALSTWIAHREVGVGPVLARDFGDEWRPVVTVRVSRSLDRLVAFPPAVATSWVAALLGTDPATPAGSPLVDPDAISAVTAPWAECGDLGPLAYLAGLTAAEAVERQHAGTLDIASLEALAGLRGHDVPFDYLTSRVQS